MKTRELKLRKAIIKQCLWMNAVGLNQGTSGNISARYDDVMLITPSAIPYQDMKPEMIAAMPIKGRAGDSGKWKGPKRPSTEWRFHLDILRARPDAGAVVHTHATYCTALAIARKDIPAVHYMMAAFGGTNVRCSDYATFGTPELSATALEAMQGRNACLLANHGMIVAGESLAKAMWLAVELETIARQYYNTLQLGVGPTVLSDEQIADTAKSFSTYGLQDQRSATTKKRKKSARKSRAA